MNALGRLLGPSGAAASAQPLPRRHRADVSVVLIVGLLLLVGLVVIYSISPILSHKITGDVSRNYFLLGHLRNLGFAMAALAFGFMVPLWQWQRWLPLLLGVTALSLLLLFIPDLAISQKGATRWLGLGPFSFQPAELVKFSLIITLATWFSRLPVQRLKDKKYTLWPMFGLLGVLSVFVMIHQKDMGSMVVIAGILVAVFFASGVRLSQLGALIGAGVAFGAINIALFPHRIERVQTFFNADHNLADTGYHLNQALIAVGSGGLFGLGLGQSVQVYGYLPEAANDSIFAIITETFGFVGGLVLIALFGILVYRCLVIARNAPDRYSQLLVLGIAAWIGLQTIVNMTAMLGIIPLTGITLPFLSYGGSSLLFIMLGLGLVLNVSKYTLRTGYADSTLRRRHGRTHHAYFGRRSSTHHQL